MKHPTCASWCLFAKSSADTVTPGDHVICGRSVTRVIASFMSLNGFPDVPELSPSPLPDAFRSVWEQTSAHADPRYWGAFVFVGA